MKLMLVDSNGVVKHIVCGYIKLENGVIITSDLNGEAQIYDIEDFTEIRIKRLKR